MKISFLENRWFEIFPKSQSQQVSMGGLLMGWGKPRGMWVISVAICPAPHPWPLPLPQVSFSGQLRVHAVTHCLCSRPLPLPGTHCHSSAVMMEMGSCHSHLCSLSLCSAAALPPPPFSITPSARVLFSSVSKRRSSSELPPLPSKYCTLLMSANLDPKPAVSAHQQSELQEKQRAYLTFYYLVIPFTWLSFISWRVIIINVQYKIEGKVNCLIV